MPKLIDLSGKSYGKLKILERAPNKGKKRTSWHAKCECGNMTIVATDDLVSGDTLSCGCLRADLLRIELKDQVFGKLKVIDRADKRGKSSSQFWKCICECKKEIIASSQHLRMGFVNSCGCQPFEDIEKYQDAFLENVEKKSECWEWKGRRTRNYGIFFTHKFIKAHRFSFLLYKGQIPRNLYVCHTCDNAICVNPEHLYVGTPKDNYNDMIKRGRLRMRKSFRGR